MLKRLWRIFGPLICAVILVFALLGFYPEKMKHSFRAERNDAVALNKVSFKSRYKKVRALSDPNHRFVPFFGSSEWSRMDAMHPSVLADAYSRGYTPYLLGQKGAASLTQYYGMQQIIPQMTNQQAVYVISPQWFVKEGANPAAFQSFLNKDQIVSFLENQTGSRYDRYAAERFLELYPSAPLTDQMKKIANGEKLSASDKTYLKYLRKALNKEDAFFSQFAKSKPYSLKVTKKAKKLPEEFSYDALSQKADHLAAKATSDNRFGISNKFYDLRIKHQYAKLKGVQENFSYIKSPEYSDLQLTLQQFAQMQTDVIFVIPPVNKKWSDYTGLDTKMYQQAVSKIKYQLQSQGFTHIVDLSQDGDKPYFMQDTIHLGWNGWLAMDKEVAPFLTQKQTTPTYHIQDKFLSKSWDNYTKTPKDFKE